MHMHTRLPTRATNHVWIVVHVCMCARARAREQEDLSVGSKKTSVFKEQEDLSVYVAAKTSSLFPLRPPPPPSLHPPLRPLDAATHVDAAWARQRHIDNASGRQATRQQREGIGGGKRGAAVVQLDDAGAVAAYV